jgi:hypothetical protein
VRGATLQIFATCPVVKTFIAGSPYSSLVWEVGWLTGATYVPAPASVPLVDGLTEVSSF